MSHVLDHWQVLPHGQLTQVDDGLLTVTGRIHMPMTEFQRRMTVVRLRDGRLVVYSALALDEDEMRQLEHYGTLAWLVVPGDHHRMDARIWKRRYPLMRVLAPAGARKAIEEAVHVDNTHAHFNDPDVSFVTVDGTGGHEGALVVRRPSGTTLIVNDLIGNMDRDAGFLPRLMGYAGDQPQIPTGVRLGLAGNKAQLRQQLLAWADDASLKRIIVSHGGPIEDRPAAELRRLAETLH